MANATETTKPRRSKATPSNGAAKESDPVAAEPSKESQNVAPQPETVAPSPGIEVLPAEVQQVLQAFKSQLSDAPEELQSIVQNYLFGSVKKEAVKSSVPNAVQPTENKNEISEPTESNIVNEFPVVKKFADHSLPDGFRALPPVMIYTAAANDYAPVRALAVDVLQWGSKPVIIARSGDPIKVLTAEGTVVQIPPKMVFAIPAESDLVNLIRPLAEDPEGAYEIFFSPLCIEKDDIGASIVRYKIAIGVRVPKSAVWPPK